MGCGTRLAGDMLLGGGMVPGSGEAVDYILNGHDGGGAQDPDPLLSEAKATINRYNKIAPLQLASINEFGPQFAKAYGNTLAATYEGTLNAYEHQISPALARVQSAQRASDIGDVATYGRASRDAILASNPDNAILLEMLNQQARGDLAAGSSLTPEEQRQMQQASRGAYAARGMSGSNSAVADELLRQYNLGAQRQAQRRQFATGVVGVNNAVVGDPFMQILGRSGQSVNAANNLLQQGQGQVSQAGAGNLYDPFKDAYSTMFHNQDIAAAEKAAKMQMTGAIVGGALSGLGGAAGAAI